MTSVSAYNDAHKRWRSLCENIQAMTIVDKQESQEAKLKRIENVRINYGAFVEYYFPHYCTDREIGKIIKSANFHIKAAKEILADKNIRAVYQWARGHAKSTHIDIFIPLWLKCQHVPGVKNMVLVGKSEASAIELLGDLQAELQYNSRYIADFGKQYNAGRWTDGRFVTADGCSFTALGRGQSPRGLRERANRPDYIVIDDLDDDELVQNPDRVRRLTQWVKEALFGCFGATGGRFIMVGNLISKTSVLYNMSNNNGVKLSRVNIYDNKGKPSWAEYWTIDRVRELESFLGYRSFQREYMNNPITEGAVFKNDWIKWKKPLPLNKYDQIVAYCDPSFKSSVKNDYKAIKVWGKIGTELHHLFAFVRQCSVAEMVRWLYDLHELFVQNNAVCNYYIETNFLQDILLDEFETEGKLRNYQLPIRGDSRKKPDKFQRIEAISPLWERGFVFYNENMQKDRDMLVGIEQLLSFEKGSRSHDDAPDADEGAIYILQKTARVNKFEPRFGRPASSKYLW